VIFDHYKSPRNHHALAHHTHVAHGDNVLCGDQVTAYLQLDGEVIADVSFEGSGCAISTASASLMTEALKGKTVAEAAQIFQKFHHLVTDTNTDNEADTDTAAGQESSLGKLEVLAGVREFPARVKYATLAWHTLQSALKDYIAPVSDEVLRENVIAALRTIYDPEIPVNILDLGLIYALDIDAEGNIDIEMTLTAPACPVAGTFPGVVEARLNEVEGVKSVHVELVWEPPWSMDGMTDEVKLEFGLL
jgi:nitrogen fixation NifU-like protein